MIVLGRVWIIDWALITYSISQLFILSFYIVLQAISVGLALVLLCPLAHFPPPLPLFLHLKMFWPFSSSFKLSPPLFSLVFIFSVNENNVCACVCVRVRGSFSFWKCQSFFLPSEWTFADKRCNKLLWPRFFMEFISFSIYLSLSF